MKEKYIRLTELLIYQTTICSIKKNKKLITYSNKLYSSIKRMSKPIQSIFTIKP